MKRMLCLLAVCLVPWALDGSVRAAPDKPSINRRTGLFEVPLSDLRKAAERGDRAELIRTAGRLGPARLGQALSDSDRRIVLAALEALPLIDAGILALDHVVPISTAPDTAVRARATRTLAGLLGRADTATLTEWEVPSESVLSACQALARVATDEGEQLATRLSATQGLADGAACASTLRAAPLLASSQPEIRRAAVWLLPAATANDTLKVVINDNVGLVAAAAAARLCMLRGSWAGLPPRPAPRELALVGDAFPEDVIAMLPCLLASGEPADRKALDELDKSGGASVRQAIKRMREKPTKP